ncbi:MAG: outer membrane lipoprotein carrier protein LolA [Alphaproteobacteria bacterium]|nr:outer membrane lipoprotein carrier protein LolA [Alphaproteobacteria bacterium]
MKKGLMVGVMALMMPFMAVADIHKSVDTPENRAILTKVENAYNSMRTIKAKFAQFNSKVKDDLQTGDLYLSKPGKMRLVYEKGSPLEFYAINGFFIYHDKDLQEVSYFDLNQTPVALILKDKLSFTDPDFVVSDVQDVLDEYFVSAHKKDAEELGTLTLVIDKDTLELKQWDVVDMQGVKSTVSLYDISANRPIKNSMFNFVNPYKEDK